MSNLAELIDRVERASGGDRELDAAVTLWQHPELAEWPRSEHGGWLSPEWGLIAPPEHLTSSVDAALGLVERVLKAPHYRFVGPALYLNIPTPLPNYWDVTVTHGSAPPYRSLRAWGATLPLAICAATLRALQEQSDGR